MININKSDAEMTHCEHSDESALQQSHHDIARVVFVVRDARVSHIQRERHQEELDRGSNQSRPFPLHPGLDMELYIQKYRFELNLKVTCT